MLNPVTYVAPPSSVLFHLFNERKFRPNVTQTQQSVEVLLPFEIQANHWKEYYHFLLLLKYVDQLLSVTQDTML